jgi:hypothetical protein
VPAYNLSFDLSYNGLGLSLGLVRLADLLLRSGERAACVVNPRYLVHLTEQQLSVRYV